MAAKGWSPGQGYRPAGMEDSDDSDDDYLSDSYTDSLRESQSSNQRNGCIGSPKSPNKDGSNGPILLNNENYSGKEENSKHCQKLRRHQGHTEEDFRTAIIRGDLAGVEFMVEQGMQVDLIFKTGWNGLMYACSSAFDEMTLYFLEQKADPNFHKDRYYPLMAACAAKNKEEGPLLRCVKALVEYGCDVNSMGRNHITPLMFAAREGRSTIVKFLLESGAKVDAVDNKTWTALMFAISEGHGDVARILLEGNATVANVKYSGQTLAEFARDKGHEAIAKLIETYEIDKTVPAVELLNNVSADATEVQPFENKRRFKAQPCGDLEMFLIGIGLSKLAPAFHLHELSFQQFLRLTDDDLKKIGISALGARKKILEGIHDVHRIDWENTSLESLDKLSISCPDAVAMVGNISKHLCYIQSTIGFLTDQIQAKPRILELGQDAQNVRTLLQGLEDALKNNKNLHEELRLMQLHLDKVQNNVDLVPANVVERRRASESDIETHTKRRSSVFRFSAIAAVACVALVVTGAWRRPLITGRVLAWKL